MCTPCFRGFYMEKYCFLRKNVVSCAKQKGYVKARYSLRNAACEVRYMRFQGGWVRRYQLVNCGLTSLTCFLFLFHPQQRFVFQPRLTHYCCRFHLVKRLLQGIVQFYRRNLWLAIVITSNRELPLPTRIWLKFLMTIATKVSASKPMDDSSTRWCSSMCFR